jgi:hypothetical protein
MKTRSFSKLGQLLTMNEALVDAAVAFSRIARRHLRPVRQPRLGRGATLRPGVDTPLWLTLVAQTRPYLRTRGAKALLARELGLDPSRISQFFVTRTASPDAERTLLLLEWLGRRRSSLLIKQGRP